MDDQGYAYRDLPLAFDLKSKAPVDLCGLGLLPRNKNHGHALTQIVLTARAGGLTKDTSYSRDKNHYGRRGTRYDGPGYTYAAVTGAVDHLAAVGLVSHWKAPPGTIGRRQSTFKATEDLIQATSGIHPVRAKPSGRSLIRLRDNEGHYRDYRDTDASDRMRRQVEVINEASGGIKIWLPPDIVQRDGDLLRIGDQSLDGTATTYYRIFNEDFNRGGRLYGHHVQQLPKRIRKLITINGEPVAEPDHASLHCRLEYLKAGLLWPVDRDAYEVPGWDRKQVKNAFLTTLNAKTREAAIRSLVFDGHVPDQQAAARLIDAIKECHRPIGPAFHSDAGARLMREDSDMAMRVMLDGLHAGIPIIGIHDSFICPCRHEGTITEFMNKALDGVARKYGVVPSIAQVPQGFSVKSTDTMVGGLFPFLPSLVSPSASALRPRRRRLSLSPRLVQPDLFGAPVVDFASFRGGVLPLETRVALNQARHDLGFTQLNLADRIGISRPQLANALAGRFGVSPELADRIDAFLHDYAIKAAA